MLAEACRKAKRVYIVGNGGSYANAVHMVNDLLSVGIKAYAMDPATLTAFANDFGYVNAFSIWIDKVGEEGDLLIALSGSGRSQNILRAIGTARLKNMEVLKIFGAERGEGMQEAEEAQVKLGHEAMLCLRS